MEIFNVLKVKYRWYNHTWLYVYLQVFTTKLKTKLHSGSLRIEFKKTCYIYIDNQVLLNYSKYHYMFCLIINNRMWLISIFLPPLGFTQGGRHSMARLKGVLVPWASIGAPFVLPTWLVNVQTLDHVRSILYSDALALGKFMIDLSKFIPICIYNYANKKIIKFIKNFISEQI